MSGQAISYQLKKRIQHKIGVGVWHCQPPTFALLSKPFKLVSSIEMLKPKWWIFFICPCFFINNGYPALSQIATDNTLPTKIIDSGNTIKILGGSKAGKNLFHSFAEFSVPNNSTAYFQNSSNISNIISRVTGQSISNIDGILKTNGNANLFLINPNGIVFGANAQLDIKGSFIATTASSIKFADGIEFSTTDRQTSPLLTVSIPIGLQFGDSVGDIVNRSVASPNGETNYIFNPVGLKITSSKTIALIGGDITLNGGNLTAEGGNIEIGSVGKNSLVNLIPSKQGWTSRYKNVNNFGNIKLDNQAVIDVSGLIGSINLNSANLKLTENSVIVNATLGKQNGGDLKINVYNSVNLISSFILNQVGKKEVDGQKTIAQNNGGDLQVSTKKLVLKDGGAISSGTVSEGNAGNLIINASDSIEITGANSVLTTSTQDIGKGGEIQIDTKNLIVKDGGRIEAATLGIGEGGNININASESVEFSGWQQQPEGIVSIAGLSASAGLEDGSIAETQNSGNLKIDTKQLKVADSAEITVSNFGSGNAGTLAIDADSIFINDRARLNATTISGNGGNINLQNVDNLLLQNLAQIATSAGDRGNGGNIFIDADTVTLINNSKIDANAVRGKGGNIQIETQGLFQSPDSKITAASALGINGLVNIKNTGLDTNRSIVKLPESPINVEGLIGNSCDGSKNFTENRFSIIGRGGLPINPDRAIELNTVQEDLGDFSDRPLAISDRPSTIIPRHFIEARGWFKNNDGNIVLVGNNSSIEDPIDRNDLFCNI
jgi:filamentous hemagglutinin family protein